MSVLRIYKKINSVSFGILRWQSEDYKVPLEFLLQGVRSQVSIIQVSRLNEKRSRMMVNVLRITLIYDEAPSDCTKLLTEYSPNSIQFAKHLYEYYSETLLRFEGIMRASGKVRNLYIEVPSLEEFYDLSRAIYRDEDMKWQIDDGEKHSYLPKLQSSRRRRNPLFKHPQLVTVEKWKKMQRDIDAKRFPSNEASALYRIAGSIHQGYKRIPVIEAAIMIESKLRTYSKEILTKKGLSRSRIRKLNDEITFNSVLNLIFPLSFNKSDLSRVNALCSRVDRIRTLRNDIVHNDLNEDRISEKEVLDGIYAAIILFVIIDSKKKRPAGAVSAP